MSIRGAHSTQSRCKPVPERALVYGDLQLMWIGPDMPTSDWSRELDAAVEAVGAAAEIAHKAFYAGSSGVQEKADLTPVSDADREGEEQMEWLLHERFPHDKIIGEEATAGEDLPPGRVWVLDPIDGTSNAITGVNPLFVSQACLLLDGDPVVAAIELPITGQLFAAAKGRGAFLHAGGKKVPLEVRRQTVQASKDVA